MIIIKLSAKYYLGPKQTKTPDINKAAKFKTKRGASVSLTVMRTKRKYHLAKLITFGDDVAAAEIDSDK